jgi:hypothetical protein
MASQSHLDDPGYWRKRANELRALAEQLSNFQARREILQMVEDYDRLAARAEQRADANKKRRRASSGASGRRSAHVGTPPAPATAEKNWTPYRDRQPIQRGRVDVRFAPKAAVERTASHMCQSRQSPVALAEKKHRSPCPGATGADFHNVRRAAVAALAPPSPRSAGRGFRGPRPGMSQPCGGKVSECGNRHRNPQPRIDPAPVDPVRIA